MKNLQTVILAAGKSTRMKSNLPKVLHPLCGRAMVDYVLDVAKAVGSLKTYLVVGHKHEEVKAHLPKSIVTVQQKKLLGTADAVKSVQGYLRSYKGDLLVMCGDTPLLSQRVIKNLIRKHKQSKASCTVLTSVVHDPKGYGRILRDGTGAVVAIREDKDAIGLDRNIAEINTGVYCFRSQDLFKGFKNLKLNKKKREFYLTDFVEIFKANGLTVETVETEKAQEGLGINTRKDLAKAEAILREKILDDLMASGVTVVDPNTTYVAAGVNVGRDTTIHPMTVIEPDVRIGEGCSIGPFARLRSGTRIGKHVEVGNFTEVVRTKIGNKCFMKHFSYLGDSQVGDGVNIGAGAVVANFDGQQKHSTTIANGAFIGSGSVMVSPVKIGKKVIVGAGSVVTRGTKIPDGRTVFGVPADVISRRKRS